MDYAALGRCVRQLRLQQGLTQQALAEKIHLSTSFVGHIERGSRKASLETVVDLCRALGTDPNSLLAAELSILPPKMLTQDMQNLLRQLMEYACHLTQAAFPNSREMP